MRLVLYAIPVVVTLYALIDTIMTPGYQARSLPKALWIVLIVLIPFLGALAWLLFGRPRREASGPGDGGGGGGGTRPGAPPGPGGPGRRRGSGAPDDDPDFLRSLDEAAWQERQRRRRSADPES